MKEISNFKIYYLIQELLALEERIGNVNTGLSEEIISNRLKHKKYIAMAYEAETETEPCCVCQVITP